jgi:hypothetical protein
LYPKGVQLHVTMIKIWIVTLVCVTVQLWDYDTGLVRITEKQMKQLSLVSAFSSITFNTRKPVNCSNINTVDSIVHMIESYYYCMWIPTCQYLTWLWNLVHKWTFSHTTFCNIMSIVNISVKDTSNSISHCNQAVICCWKSEISTRNPGCSQTPVMILCSSNINGFFDMRHLYFISHFSIPFCPLFSHPILQYFISIYPPAFQ